MLSLVVFNFRGMVFITYQEGDSSGHFFKYHDLTATLLEMMVLIGNPK
jgi:hypothetical protein